MEEWTITPERKKKGKSGFLKPATCAFSAETMQCTFSSGRLCAFNTAPPSACGLFNSTQCHPAWNELSACHTLLSHGYCAPDEPAIQ